MKTKIYYALVVLAITASIVWAAQQGPVVDTDTLNEAFAISDANDDELYAVSGVSDCTVGPCFDGTADSGTILYLMNPAGTFWTSIQGGATTANRVIRPPIGAPGAGNLVETDASGNWSYTDTLNISWARYSSYEGATVDEHQARWDSGDPTADVTYPMAATAAKEIGWTITDTGVATAVADGLQGFVVPASMVGMNITSVIAVVDTAGTTGTTDIQLRRVRAGTPVDVLSTVATIDTTELTTETAATPYVINTSNDDLALGDKLFPDIDAISTTPAEGLSFTVGLQWPED